MQLRSNRETNEIDQLARKRDVETGKRMERPGGDACIRMGARLIGIPPCTWVCLVDRLLGCVCINDFNVDSPAQVRVLLRHEYVSRDSP